MPMYAVEITKVTRTTVLVEAASAAEIKRRVADVADSYADDLFLSGQAFRDHFPAPIVHLAPKS